MADDSLVKTAQIIEALIFASQKPVYEKDCRPYLVDSKLDPDTAFDQIIAHIARRYDETSGIMLSKIGTGYAFRTRPEVAHRLNIKTAVERPLSRAALEVLAIIAYHQPVTRAEIEDIRGISLSRGTMDILLELGWIKPRGRRRTPGRPLTWGTAPQFLDYFGLSQLTDLPGVDELKAAGLLKKGMVLGGVGEAGERVADQLDENPDQAALSQDLWLDDTENDEIDIADIEAEVNALND
ncbi:MAG: SMC-Scp complex subunit ScpB [Candidatus Puniceispirillaceae bacterium]